MMLKLNKSDNVCRFFSMKVYARNAMDDTIAEANNNSPSENICGYQKEK